MSGKDKLAKWIRENVDPARQLTLEIVEGFIWLNDVDADTQSDHGVTEAECETCNGDFANIFATLSD